MIPQIPGTEVEENDNDPVEVREFEILGSTLDETLGRFPTSPIWTDEAHFWRYFPNGMIVSGPGTCASVLFGPIVEHYAEVGQFRGHLGAAGTDVTALPDGTSYAVFEGGVVWVDKEGNVNELTPMAPSVVKAFSELEPSVEGITQFAQEKIQKLAENALQTNQRLRENVNKITASVSFDSTGQGACRGAGFNNPGRTLPRSHIFRVHFDFELSGCAGLIGGASADLHITVRVQVNPPTVSGFMETYSIDEVSSPGGFGDEEITNGLNEALVQQYGKDLIGKELPTGFTVLAVVVDTEGNANVYLEPLCTTGTLLARVEPPQAESTLALLRELRDVELARSPHRGDLVQILDAFGRVFVAALRAHHDGERLREHVADLLVNGTRRPDAARELASLLEEPARRMSDLLAAASRCGGLRTIERLSARSVAFVREEVRDGRDLRAVLAALTPALDEEIRDLEARPESNRTGA